jgi:hypothetical protein
MHGGHWPLPLPEIVPPRQAPSSMQAPHRHPTWPHQDTRTLPTGTNSCTAERRGSTEYRAAPPRQPGSSAAALASTGAWGLYAVLGSQLIVTSLWPDKNHIVLLVAPDHTPATGMTTPAIIANRDTASQPSTPGCQLPDGQAPKRCQPGSPTGGQAPIRHQVLPGGRAPIRHQVLPGGRAPIRHQVLPGGQAPIRHQVLPGGRAPP